MADQISDAVLDALLADDPNSRVACETLLTTGLVLVFALLLGWFLLPLPAPQAGAALAQAPLSDVLWGQRGLDVLVQVVLIFSGVLGLLGLLAEVRPPLEGSAAEEVIARRRNAMQALEADVSPQEGSQQ